MSSGEKSGLVDAISFGEGRLMSQVAELFKEASKLDRAAQVELVSSLLGNLDDGGHHVSDEEAMGRLEELKNGSVRGLSEEEFWKACGRE